MSSVCRTCAPPTAANRSLPRAGLGPPSLTVPFSTSRVSWTRLSLSSGSASWWSREWMASRHERWSGYRTLSLEVVCTFVLLLSQLVSDTFYYIKICPWWYLHSLSFQILPLSVVLNDPKFRASFALWISIPYFYGVLIKHITVSLQRCASRITKIPSVRLFCSSSASRSDAALGLWEEHILLAQR